MFGRLVDVIVCNSRGVAIKLVDHLQGSQALICEGDIEAQPAEERTKLELSVYNLSANIRSTIKSEELDKIIVKFGYKDLNDGELDIIFMGDIKRIIHQREDAVTSLTKFYAYEMGDCYDYGYFSGVILAGTSCYDAVMTIAKNGTQTIPVIPSEALKRFEINKSKSYYGKQMELICTIAKSCNMSVYTNNGRVIINTEQENYSTEVIIMSATNERNKLVSASGLIGIPTMTDDGVQFECLINPRMTVFSLVLIANSLISDTREGFEPSNQAGAEFDQNGIYRVISIDTHFTNGMGESKMTCKALSREYYADTL